MANLTVLDDTAQECAVLVDTDTWTPLPIVSMGENRVNLLQAFVDSVPFDLTLLNDAAMREAWVQFLEQHGALPTTPAESHTADEMVAQSRNGDDDAAALAQAEAAAATDEPPPQPADTDTAENPPSATVIVRCWNCEGTGQVVFGDNEPARTCGICHGTGKVEQVVAA
jgi:ribosomal protein S27E